MKTIIRGILVLAAMTMSLTMTTGAFAFIQADHDKVKSTGICKAPCDLSSDILAGITLRDLTGARCTSANLIGAVVATGLKLNSANFMSAKLNNLNLSTATMNGTTSFAGANLTGVTPPTAGWGSANLTGATWIDGVKKCAANSYGVCK